MTNTKNNSLSVAVIGAGAAGLAAIKELKMAGVTVKAFERGSCVGGRWSLEKPAGVWRELNLNGNRRFMEYSDYPWHPEKYTNSDKAHHGFFPHWSEALEYLQDYSKHFDLLPCIEFETDVKNAFKKDGGKGWAITTSKGGIEQTRDFDYLVVCSGMLAVANDPLKNTVFKDFEGEKLHAQDFKCVEGYEGKNVLVIGSGTSGADITSLLSEKGGCKSVVNSVRSLPYRVHVVSQTDQRLFDDILSTRLPVWLKKVLPESATTSGLKSILLANWPDQPTKELYGLEPDADVRNSAFYPDRYYMQRLQQGKFKLVPGIDSVSGKTVEFKDGTKQEFDVVIMCTGYNFDFSFFPADVKEKVTTTNPVTGSNDVALYKMTLSPEYDDLAFCGVFINFGPHWTMAEMQARWIAALVSGRVARPSTEQLKAGVIDTKAFRARNKINRGDVGCEFWDAIGNEIGVVPSKFKILSNPNKYLLCPNYPCTYRTNPLIDGEETAKKCQERLDYFHAHPQVADAL